jgi:anti-anti-sigma factor
MDDKRLIDIEHNGETSIVSFRSMSISGLSEVDALGRELHAFIDTNNPKKIIVDFQTVKFLSSQILGLLVGMWRKVKDKGGTVVISGINPQLTRVFKITNLDKIFTFYPDRQSALDAEI